MLECPPARLSAAPSHEFGEAGEEVEALLVGLFSRLLPTAALVGMLVDLDGAEQGAGLRGWGLQGYGVGREP